MPPDRHLDDDRARSTMLSTLEGLPRLLLWVFDGIVHQVVEHIAQHLPFGRKIQIIRLNI